MKCNQKFFLSSKTIFSIVFLVTLLLGTYRIIGYYFYDIPYGYDPGFFRYTINTSLAALPNLPPPPNYNLPYQEPLFGLLGTILIFIGYSVDTIIGPFLGFLSLFTGFALYFLGKQHFNKSVGLLSGSLFFLSIIQYQGYWWNYWRNIVGIIFMIFAFGLLQKRSYLTIPLVAGLFTIHRPSALYFAVVFVIVYSIRSFLDRKFYWKEWILVFVGGLFALPLYWNQFTFLLDTIEPIASTIGGVSSSGTFLTTRDFFITIFPYFLVLIPAIFYKMEKKEFDVVFVGFLVGLTWSVLRLFFYNRMLLFFDIFIILMTAYSVVFVISQWSKSIKYGILSLFLVVQGYLFAAYIFAHTSQHTIKREEFDIVQNLDIIVPEKASVLSTYRGYTPWLLGYGKRTILAPGLLENQIWSEEKWNQFYFKADDALRCKMIQEYQSVAPELYVFVGDNQPSLLLPEACFLPILSNTSHPLLYEVIYKK